MPTVQIDIAVAADTSLSWWFGPLSPAFVVDPNGIVCQNGGNLSGIFMRFPGVAIPRDALILNAWMRLTAGASAGAVDPRVRVKANDVDDAVAPTTYAEAEAIRTGGQTAAFVDWTLPPWTIGDFGPDQQTPNISPVVQEIVDRPGWASGNALMVVGIGLFTGSARAQFYDCVLCGSGGTIRFFSEYTDRPGGSTGTQQRTLLL